MACRSALHHTTDTLASFFFVRVTAFSSQPYTHPCYSLPIVNSFTLSDSSFVLVSQSSTFWSVSVHHSWAGDSELVCSVLFFCSLKPEVHQQWLDAADAEKFLLMQNFTSSYKLKKNSATVLQELSWARWYSKYLKGEGEKKIKISADMTQAIRINLYILIDK